MKKKVDAKKMKEGLEFEIALQKHLWKCELEYRAKMLTCASTVEWLAPFCNSTADIASFLRDIGFKIAKIVDEEPWPGLKHQWVVTTSGIIVYVNSPNCEEGLVAGV